MARGNDMSELLRSLGSHLGRPGFVAVSDAVLLRAHIVDHSEAAFAALVDRYGRLVWHWCRRILGPGPDAEDAFQATFLVMSRRAASIRPDAVAGWLHAVSRRVATRALARRVRRQSAEIAAIQNRNQPTNPNSTEPTGTDLLAALDEELARLPERYRTPLMLCFWQGMTQTEAARCLGCSAGSIKGRLERGRRWLAQRLTRRGFAPQAILLATVSLAAAPGDLLGRATMMAHSNGEIPAAIAALAENAIAGVGVKMKIAVTAMLVAVALTAGVMADGGAKETNQSKSPASDNRKPEEKTKPQARVDLYGDPLPEGAIARMGTTQFHYQSPQAAFSKDGKTLLVVDRNGVVYLNDVKTGKQIGTHRIELPKLKNNGVAIRALSPNGKFLAIASDDEVILYDAFAGKELRRLQLELARWSELVFSPDGIRFASLEREGDKHARVRIWETATGNNVCSLQLGQPLSFILHGAFSHDGKLFATAEYGEPHLRLWDASTGKMIRQYKVMDHQQVAFAPDDKIMAVGGWQGITILDTSSVKQLAQMPLPSPEGVTSLKFSPDGSLLSGGRQLGDLLLWDVGTKKLKSRVDALHVDFQTFSPDSRTLAVWGQETNKDIVELWDVKTGKQVHLRPGHTEFIYSLASSQNGSVIASGALRDPDLRIWDATTGRQLCALRTNDTFIHSAALSPDGKLAASGGQEGTVQLWDLTTGKELLRFEVTRPLKGAYWVDQLQFSADGTRLAVVQVSFGIIDHPLAAMLRVWDTTTRRILVERPLRTAIYSRKTPNGGTAKTIWSSFGFDPTCEFVTVQTESELKIENVRTGSEVAAVGSNLGLPLLFSSDSRLLAVSHYKPRKDPFENAQIDGISLVETISGREVQRIEGNWLRPLGFSPDGRLLFAHDNKAILVYDVASAKEVFRRQLQIETGWPAAPLGTENLAVVTGMPDGTLLVWDMSSEKWKLPPKAASEKPVNVQQLWGDLKADARTAFHAANLLADSPAKSLPLLRESLKPAPVLDQQGIERLINQLEDKQFTVRENAMKELRQKRDEVDPILKQWREKTQSPEVRRRIKEILDGPVPTPSAERLRELRAVGVLEHIGNADARALLDKLAAGDPNSRLTRAAKASLARLTRPVD